jgi:hypothetical protein
MQIFKLLPTACAVVVCASFISVRAQDTPVQAAAREALAQKMQELDAPKTQAPPRAVTSPGAVKPVPATATAPAAAVAVPAASETTPAAPVATQQQSPAATTTAETIPATPPPAETKPATMMAPVEPVAAATIATETNAAPAASETTPAAPVATTPAITPAAGTVPQSPAMPAVIRVKPGVMNATNQINAIFPGKELGLQPIEAPLLPITATQQAQLQALLARYKANQISPEEYHRQRAEILAQP